MSLTILSNFKNSVVWIVSILLLISHSSSSLSKFLGTIPSAQTTIGISIPLIFRRFFVLLFGPSIYISFRFLLLSVCGLPEWQYPQDIKFSYLCYLTQGLVVGSGLGDPPVSQNPRKFYASHSTRRILVYAFTNW